MAEVVDADAEVDSACPHRGQPDLGAEGVARDRRADRRGEQQIVSSDRFSTEVRRNFVQQGLTDAECPRLVVLRVPLHDEALTGRRVLLGRLDDGARGSGQDHAQGLSNFSSRLTCARKEVREEKNSGYGCASGGQCPYRQPRPGQRHQYAGGTRVQSC
jgi:hypothetical protein